MNNREKSGRRVALEEKVRVLNQDDLFEQQQSSIVAQKSQQQKTKRRVDPLKLLAGLVLFTAVGIAFFPALGTAYTLFYISLSIYFWQGLIGLCVVLGMAAALWAFWVLVFKDSVDIGK